MFLNMMCNFFTKTCLNSSWYRTDWRKIKTEKNLTFFFSALYLCVFVKFREIFPLNLTSQFNSHLFPCLVQSKWGFHSYYEHFFLNVFSLQITLYPCQVVKHILNVLQLIWVGKWLAGQKKLVQFETKYSHQLSDPWKNLIVCADMFSVFQICLDCIYE